MLVYVAQLSAGARAKGRAAGNLLQGSVQISPVTRGASRLSSSISNSLQTGQSIMTQEKLTQGGSNENQVGPSA